MDDYIDKVVIEIFLKNKLVKFHKQKSKKTKGTSTKINTFKVDLRMAS